MFCINLDTPPLKGFISSPPKSPLERGVNNNNKSAEESHRCITESHSMSDVKNNLIFLAKGD